MNEKIEQASAGVASELNAELDNRLYYVEPIAFKNKKHWRGARVWPSNNINTTACLNTSQS